MATKEFVQTKSDFYVATSIIDDNGRSIEVEANCPIESMNEDVYAYTLSENGMVTSVVKGFPTMADAYSAGRDAARAILEPPEVIGEYWIEVTATDGTKHRVYKLTVDTLRSLTVDTLRSLIGYTIADLEWFDSGFGEPFPTLILQNFRGERLLVIVQADPEGNGPGHLEVLSLMQEGR